MDRPHWPQEIVVKPMKEILVPNTTNSTTNNNLSKPSSSSSSFERKTRPQKAAAVNCPRCDSTNTKFCYYNNYSLSQPRYFCKSCRRYWTEGGTLRNIPVGGGSRKNKRSSSCYNSSVSKALPDLVVPSGSRGVFSQNPRIHLDQYGQDLNLGFPSNFNFDVTRNIDSSFSSATTTTATTTSALELLTGITTNSFMSTPILEDPGSCYTALGQLMIPIPEFKIPSLSFSLDGMGSGAYENSVHEGNGGRVLFPFEEVKRISTSTTHDDDDDPHVGQDKDQNCDSNGFWNGMMGGGSW